MRLQKTYAKSVWLSKLKAKVNLEEQELLRSMFLPIRLAKKYPSFKQDYKEFLESIKNNPLQGDEITKNIRKIRMAIKAKGKGKSGGARVITFNVLANIENGQVVLLLLYDKEDASTVKVNVVKQLVRDMGFDIE